MCSLQAGASDESHQVFDAWYAPNGMGSGHGSSPRYTERYRRFLMDFLRTNAIKSVLDWGCGDWQFSKLIDWSGLNYVGTDVVAGLIERLNIEHGRNNVTFALVDPSRPEECLEGFEGFDLVICKDVLQHLPNAEARRLVDLFSKIGRHVMLINDVASTPDDNNREIRIGGYRRVDPARDPFSLLGQNVFEFSEGGEGKTAFLYAPPGPGPLARHGGPRAATAPIVEAVEIPRLIHQTYKTHDVPFGVYDERWMTSWRDHHPGWKYKLWSDDDLLELAKREHPPAYGAMAGAPGVVRADIGRYLVLNVHGGMYADLDYECFRSIEPLLGGSQGLVVSENEINGAVGQAWLAFVPRHPFMRECLDEAIARWLAGVRPVEMATGPLMLTELLAGRKGISAGSPGYVTVLPARLMCPIPWQGPNGRAIAQGNLSRRDIAGLRKDLLAAGAFAATYWTHYWSAPR